MGDNALFEFIQKYKWPYGLKLSETDDGGKMCFDFALAVCEFERERLVIEDSNDWKRLRAFKPGGAVEGLVKNAISEFHSRHKGKDDLKYYDAKGTTLLRTEDCQFCKAIAELEALLPKKESEAKGGKSGRD